MPVTFDTLPVRDGWLDETHLDSPEYPSWGTFPQLLTESAKSMQFSNRCVLPSRAGFNTSQNDRRLLRSLQDHGYRLTVAESAARARAWGGWREQELADLQAEAERLHMQEYWRALSLWSNQ